MLRFIVFILALGTIYNIQLAAQELQISDWQAYTSLYEINSLEKDGDNIYVATRGGVYFANSNTGDTEQFSNVGSLSRINAQFITHDEASDKVFVGYIDGTFDIYHDDEWTGTFDIYNANFSNPQINDMVIIDEKVYIAGGFGLVVFNHKENVTIEDVKRFADVSPGTEVYEIEIHDNRIWLATAGGIVYTDLDNSLANRFDWQTILPANQFDSEDIISLKWIDSKLYSTSGDNIYIWENDSLKNLFSFNEKVVKGLVSNEDQLYYFLDNEMKEFPSHRDVFKIDEFVNSVEFDDTSDKIYIGSTSGIQILDGESQETIRPNSPITNGFADIFVDSKGTLWAGTGRVGSNEIRNRALMYLEDGEWGYYNRTDYPVFDENRVIRINELNNGDITASTFGGGMYIFPNEERDNISSINFDNSPLETITGSGSFTITGDTYEDEQGNLWIVNWGNSGNGPLFVVRTPTGGYETIFHCLGSQRRTTFKMEVDLNRTKWVGSSGADVKLFGAELPIGLTYYNDRGTLSDKSDDICGLLTTNNSDLISNTQTALAMDKQGTLWVGTVGGVNRIVNPSAVFNNSTPIIVNVRPMANQNVREIVVDATDNKWVATAEGLFVLDPEGEDVIRTINKDNSPLPTNELYSLEYDENTGKIYIGTDQGMYSLQTSAVKPVESFDVKVFPQPFDNQKDDVLTIEGLAENSDIRIVTVNGELVKKKKVNSRITTWDGRNEFGQKVSPGVYLLYAVSETKDDSQVVKVAIVNK